MTTAAITAALDDLKAGNPTLAAALLGELRGSLAAQPPRRMPDDELFARMRRYTPVGTARRRALEDWIAEVQSRKATRLVSPCPPAASATP